MALSNQDKRIREKGATPTQNKKGATDKSRNTSSNPSAMNTETVIIDDPEEMDTGASLGKPDTILNKANNLARKLDDSLKQVDTTTNNITTGKETTTNTDRNNPTKTNKHPPPNGKETNNNKPTKHDAPPSSKPTSLSFSSDTQFSGNGPALPRNLTVLTPKFSTVAAKSPTIPPAKLPAKTPSTTPTSSSAPSNSTKTKAPKLPPEPKTLQDDPEPEGLIPTPCEHLYSFVARIEVNVPACNSIPIKILNLLAHGVSILRHSDPSATFLHLTDNSRQAGTIQEMPRFQDFFKHWSNFEHVMENFRNYRLDNNKTRKFKLSALIGCNTEPKELLLDCFIDFDRDISAAQGGGKVSFVYKELQVVDTNRNWILFGVPASTHPESFALMVKPILQDAMHKMAAKNPTGKYPVSKYGGELPPFAVSCMYAQHVPFEMSKGLDDRFKRCIHFEIRSSDAEIFANIFKYMGLSHLDKRYFGELARFFEGPGPEATQAQKSDLGQMLQNHVAVTRSMGKVSLSGILNLDKVITCQLSVDADGDERNDVHISLRRILMKQRINKPKVWQCILPNANGGWEGYYANGFGCGQHKQQALMWAASVAAHTRFHLLKRGVLPESVANFIHNVFTNDAAVEAFAAKLINGEVFTYGAATAAAMSLAIKNSDWVDASMGMAEAKTASGDAVYSRPLIALQFNTDLAEHNYATDRIPAINDSGSVAYSTGGNTTLGDSVYSVGEGNEVEYKVLEHSDGNSIAASSIGSTDSQDWGVKTKSTGGVIDNMDMLIETPVPTALPEANQHTKGGIIDNMNIITKTAIQPTAPNTSQPLTMEELQKQIIELRATNLQLLAAASLAGTTTESHPTAKLPDGMGATSEEGGGDR